MNRCGTCKYFGSVDADDLDDGFRVCALIKEPRFNSVRAPAHVVDGSGYYAALCVSDDFGCNQWEASRAQTDT